MIVAVLQENLLKGINIVKNAIESRPTMPVLGNILIETDSSKLKLAAIDMSLGMGITCWIGASITKEGGITLPSKTLMDLVAKLSPEKVELNLDEATQTVHLRCGSTKSNIKGIDASEFPPVPEQTDGDFAIDGKVFKQMIAQTVFASATEDNRPILTGVLMKIEGDNLTLTSSDGYRLAVRSTKLIDSLPKPVELVIPARALANVAKIISDDDSEVLVTLPSERDVVTFQTKNVVISAQILEGKFPDVSAIIPKDYRTSCTVPTADFLRICQRADVFARDNHSSGRIIMTPAQSPTDVGTIMVSSKSNERGDNESLIETTIHGEGLNISFNIKYLMDVLNVVDDYNVVFQSNGTGSPGVIRLENRDDFVHIIMPMTDR
ncbi:MAG: DNA polymerase III subunit beta [Phototrophicales bacterium]|nr:DNA polymerase III subunit beta [Phototrophicales bacterium]